MMRYFYDMTSSKCTEVLGCWHMDGNINDVKNYNIKTKEECEATCADAIQSAFSMAGAHSKKLLMD